jgi:hypothetical protein
MKFLTLILSAFLVTCTTAEPIQGFKYSADDPDGIIAPAVWSGHEFNDYVIHRVDLKSGKFVGAPVKIAAPGRALPLAGTETDGASYFLELVKVPPGEYALISRIYGRRPTALLSWGQSGTYGQTIRTCYSEGSPVFKIDAGKVSVVKFETVAVRPSLLRRYRDKLPEVIARYPSITAPAEIVEPQEMIKFSSEFKEFEKKCEAGTDFTVAEKRG